MATNPQSSTPPRPRSVRRRQSGLQQMLYGILLAVVGVIATVISNAIASSTGSSTYIVFTGLIIVGVIYAIWGFIRWIAKR